jgi:biotin carboxylase
VATILLVASALERSVPADHCKALGHRVAILCEELPPGAAFVDDLVRVPDLLDHEAIAVAARSYHARMPVAAVTTFDEFAVEPTAVVARALGVIGLDLDAARAARDKVEMRRRFDAVGIPSPRWRYATTMAEARAAAADIGYPVVIKPRRAGASIGVVRVDDEGDLLGILPAIHLTSATLPRHTGTTEAGVLVEEYLDGPELSVEAMTFAGETMVVAVVDKPDPMDGPYFEEKLFVTPSSLPLDEQRKLAALTLRAIAALGITTGPTHTEIRLTRLGPRILEIGARLGGARHRLLELSRGIELIELTVRSALGERPAIDPEWWHARQYVGLQGISVARYGTITAIRGVEAAQEVPGVVEVRIVRATGTVLLPYPFDNPYVGPIVAAGDTYQAVVEAIRTAHDLITVDVEATDDFDGVDVD